MIPAIGASLGNLRPVRLALLGLSSVLAYSYTDSNISFWLSSSSDLTPSIRSILKFDEIDYGSIHVRGLGFNYGQFCVWEFFLLPE
jgi:hypothetical protein